MVDLQDRTGKPFELATIPVGGQQVAIGICDLGGPTGQLGYQRIADLATATTLDVPKGALQATLIVEGGDIRIRNDGIDPTPNVGMPYPDGTIIVLNGEELMSLRVIQAASSSGSAILNVAYEG